MRILFIFDYRPVSDTLSGSTVATGAGSLVGAGVAGAGVAGAFVGVCVCLGTSVGFGVGALVGFGVGALVGFAVSAGFLVSSDGFSVGFGVGSSVDSGVSVGTPFTGVGVGEVSYKTVGDGVGCFFSVPVLKKFNAIKNAIKNISISPTIVPITANILLPFAFSLPAL